MFKKMNIEYVLSAMLVLVALFSIWGKRVTLLRLDDNYQNAISSMEENFRTLYLSKDLRIISHSLNVHGTRYFLTLDKDDQEKLLDSREDFYSTIDNLKAASAFSSKASRNELDRLRTLQQERSKYLQDNIHLSFKEKQAILLSPRVKKKNEELRSKLEHLVTREINFYNQNRESLLTYKDEVKEENLLISLLLIMIAVIFALIVFRLSRMLRLAHKDALLAINARDEILAIVSHDLKNPLSSISLNTDVILRKLSGSNNEMILKGLTRIKNAVETMKGLIMDLLDQAKMESGKLELELQQEKFQEVLNEAEDLLVPLAKDKSIKIINHLPEKPLAISVDKKRLLQILSNLLSNAVKFSPEGGKVEVEALVQGNSLQVSVSDAGGGISEKDLPHVFDRYWQASITAKKGTGLGLSIVKGLVSAHGGKIWVKSILGEGTIFTFTLPLQR